MTFEMRELKGDDLFTLLGIVGKLDIKDEFIKMFEDNSSATPKIVPMDHKKKAPTKKEADLQAQAEKEAEKRGMEVAANLLQKVLLNIKKIKLDVNELLADLTEKEIYEIQNLSLKDYTALLLAFFKKPELADFFSSIASLLV